MAPRQSKVDTSHAQVSYLDTEGPGQPLVLLHGNSVSKESFAPQVQELGGRYRVIALDLPGHGASGNAVDAPSTYSFSGYADCIVEVLDKLGIRETVLVGHSLGGHVALEVTARVSVRGLILTGAPPFRRDTESFARAFGNDPRAPLAVKAELTDIEVDQFAAGVLDAAGEKQMWREMIRRTDPEARSGLGATLLAETVADQQDLAEAFAGPTLVMNGAEDTFINHAYADTVRYRDLWQGRVFRIEDQRHAPHLNAARAFNDLASEFLRALS